jgi:ABC-type glycerol-3-phosphate transport system substrate-binding protein
MTIDCKQSRRRVQEEEEGDEESCCSTCDYAAATGPVRIVTSSHIAPTLQTYVNFFNQLNEDQSTKPIRLSVLSSFQELNWEAVFDAKVQAGLYDGFVIPPMMVGGLYEHQSLASLESFRSTRLWNDLLPYYRDHMATYDGTIRSIPLFSGNQMLLLFRKDYLDARNMPTPKTWSEFTRVAAVLHDEPLGADGERIYGVCLGRMSEEACRRRMDTTGEDCQSLSMTYLGMALASMTQPRGNATGWLFDDDTSMGMKPMLNGTLEQILISMEELMKYGAPEEMQLDASVNIDLFTQGRCAMTLAADHPADLLQDENVGFVPLLGANKVFDRDTENLVDCTDERCPYGTSYFNSDSGIINRAPFGAHDMVVGGVSTFAPTYNQEVIKEFFEFVLTTKLNISVREQPMTFSELQSSNVEGYLELMEELTSNENAAIPFRVPGAFPLLADLDNRVYNYLLDGNYSSTKRADLRKSVEKTWDRQILRRDSQFGAISTSIFYEKSLGIFTAEPSSDLYIGSVARYIGWGFGGISCLLSLYCALWVWKNQGRRVVICSQPIFLWLVCFGTFVMAACVFPFGIEDDNASQNVADIACMASFWFYSLGYVLIFCALFSKIWRVNQVRMARCRL